MKKLRITALQRLGKRVDRLDAEVRGHGLRLDGLAQRVQELAQTFAETAHMGNFEAMYRLEREENVRLRVATGYPFKSDGRPAVEPTIVEGWIAQLESLVQQLRGQPVLSTATWSPDECQVRCLEPGCYAYQSMAESPHAHRIDPAKRARDFGQALTAAEQRIVEKFGIELSRGVAGTSLERGQEVGLGCRACGRVHPPGPCPQ